MKHPATLATLLTLLAPATALAGTTSQPSFATPLASAPTSSPEWQVRCALYGWIEALDGDMGVAGRTVPVSIGFDDILENLDLAVMGSLEISRGRWSFVADLNYAELGGDTSNGIDTIKLDLEQFLGNFNVTYNVIETETTNLSVYAGARVNSLDVDISFNRGMVAQTDVSGSETWVDPIIGLRYQRNLSDAFFFRAVGDIGGFGVSSDLTWQAFAGFGWHVCNSGSLVLGYRAIGTDYTDGGFTYDMTTHGPIIGFEYRF